MPFYSIYWQQLQRWPPLNKMRLWLTPARQRYLWHGITIISFVLTIIGMAYAWRKMPEGEIVLSPIYLGVSVIIYAITYAIHLFGWHSLAIATLGRLPLRLNVEAVATSDLVKYLPTVAWYIANRVHFYEQQQIRRNSVVAASLLEMVIMLGAGTFMYLVLWLIRAQSWLLLLGTLIIIMVILILVYPRINQWWRTRISAYQIASLYQGRYGIIALFWYSISWPIGGLFLVTVLHIFTPVSMADYWSIFYIWLGAALLGSFVSIGIGTLGIAREMSLTYLLAQYWPLPASIATAISVKIILTLGQVFLALVILGWLRLLKKK